MVAGSTTTGWRTSKLSSSEEELLSILDCKTFAVYTMPLQASSVSYEVPTNSDLQHLWSWHGIKGTF